MSDTKTKTSPLDDPRVTKNDDGSYTVQLLYPVQIIQGDAPMTSVTLSRVRGRGMVAMLDTDGTGSRLAPVPAWHRFPPGTGSRLAPVPAWHRFPPGTGSRLARLMLASAQLVGPVAEAFMDNVEGPDFLFLTEVAATFLGNGQTTGQ